MQDYSYVYWMHILFVGPLLIYIGSMKQDTPDIVYNFVLALGAVVVLYHGYKLYQYKLKK
jgi:hypothetical protein